MKTGYLFILLLGVNFVSGQVAQAVLGTVDNSDKSTISGFAYPLFVDGETHKSYMVSYAMHPKLKIEWEEFYNTYRTLHRVRNILRAKFNLDEKWHLFTGVEMEREIQPHSAIRPLPPRVGLLGGLGYEVNPGFVLEAGANMQINKSPMGAFGESVVPMPEVYTLKGKIKF